MLVKGRREKAVVDPVAAAWSSVIATGWICGSPAVDKFQVEHPVEQIVLCLGVVGGDSFVERWVEGGVKVSKDDMNGIVWEGGRQGLEEGSAI